MPVYSNNHIHTTYSFSPYAPGEAVRKAKEAGLSTAGIMDHDSVGGCEEFIAAGAALGLPVTVGFELRVRMQGTPFRGRTLNHPDQQSIAYVAAHGIPHQKLAACEAFLAPYRRLRNHRNQQMCEKLNALLPDAMRLDFERDVLPLSRHGQGGSVTERHILCGLSRKILHMCGKGEPAARFLRELQIPVTNKIMGYLLDADNPHYLFDLLGVLKSGLMQHFYVEAQEECPDVRTFLDFVHRIDAISAYAYLGDVGDSVTGDKKTQPFEDAFLDELFIWLEQAGFRAVTYMPTRNSAAQLRRVMELCAAHGLFQISGEDINSPRQSFLCPALAQPEFAHLNRAAWALIGHERLAGKCLEDGMFSAKTLCSMPLLEERIAYFAQAEQGVRL